MPAVKVPAACNCKAKCRYNPSPATGLSCALELAGKGISAAVFDMGTRTVGGRCCSRGAAPLAFDHGAQLLPRPHSTAFKAALDTWLAAGGHFSFRRVMRLWERRET